MTKWDARIEVFQGEKRIGWTHIRDIATDTLPRVGDRVSFWTDMASADLLRFIPMGAADGATVTQVEHMVGRVSTEVVVVVRASVARFITDAQIEDLRKLTEGWLPAQ